ncbi:MAG: tetratricopeptide repeat protein [Treponema sp.]
MFLYFPAINFVIDREVNTYHNMLIMSTIIISVFIIALVLAFVIVVSGKVKNARNGANEERRKDVSALMRDATKRLTQNPQDVTGLTMMGEVAFQQQNWEKAYSCYASLMDKMAELPVKEQRVIMLRCGISGVKTSRNAEARKGLMRAYAVDPHDADTNYYLGLVYYLDKEYDKAVSHFKKTLVARAGNYLALKYLGQSLQKMHKYSEAIPNLKKAMDIKPDDKEMLFAMGECFYETGSAEKCLKILDRLRADPTFGAQSSLYTGMIRAKWGQYKEAKEDFIIGLKHMSIPLDIANDLRYRLSQAYIKLGEINSALTVLRELQQVSPGYKDVSMLMNLYQEMNKNKNLQTYLMSGQSEFVGLCRRIVGRFYGNMGKVKILDIQVVTEYSDIIVEVNTPKFSDTVLFRFFRSQGSIGELLLREFHSKIRDTKGGRGICMTPGTFTDDAIRYSEGRPIELFDKAKLSAMLNKIQ